MAAALTAATSFTHRKPPGGQRRPSLDSSSRHSDPQFFPGPSPDAILTPMRSRGQWVESDPLRVRPSLARRVVHQLLRIAARARRPERGEPWAVADQRRSAPVGESVATYTLVVIFSKGGVPHITAGTRLVTLDNA